MRMIAKPLFGLAVTLLSANSMALAQGATPPTYRVFFVNSSAKTFNPEQDVLNPTQVEEVQNEIRTQVMSAAIKSVLPFVSDLKSSDPNKLSMTAQDQLVLMVSNLRKEMAGSLKVAAANAQVLPVSHSFMLVPNFGESTGLFYNSDKISMSSTELVNVLELSPNLATFDAKVTEALKEALTKKLIAVPNAQLLAARTDIFVTDVDHAKMKIQIVVKLDPMSSPFVEENDQVKFETLVIPKNTANPPVAVLTFAIDLSQKPSDPTLTVQLGGFDKYEKGQFSISSVDRKNLVPRLEGRANKSGLKWVAVKVGFSDLKFDLVNLKLTSINTLTQPGLRVGKSAFVVGGFNIESVDQQFQSEINKKIDAEVQAAIKKGQDAIESGLVTTKVIDALLTKILK